MIYSEQNTPHRAQIRLALTLEELPRFARAISSKPRIFIKRDDATTVGLGGNKVRKLDFAMAEVT